MIDCAPRPDVRSSNRADLLGKLAEWKVPAYRADQTLEWLYRHRVSTWEAMANLPRDLRGRLAEAFEFSRIETVRCEGSVDSTRKFLWRLRDGSLIETVLIPANPALYSEASDRHTLCVSTQVGCAYGCRFCASGLDGFKRNLNPAEIVGQVLEAENYCAKETVEQGGSTVKLNDGRVIGNLVFMGMGEPLANYENVMAALRILNAEWGGGIGARKMTLSTSGLAPQIRKLADEPEQFRLAISLHGATDPVRDRIMPVNRKYPLKELSSAIEYYQEKKGRLITFEYILIKGINDGGDQIGALAALSRRLHAKVNLIPYNTVEGLPWERPGEETQERFLAGLQERGITATLRREKGHDIDAACGQLRLRTEREAKPGPVDPGVPEN